MSKHFNSNLYNGIGEIQIRTSLKHHTTYMQIKQLPTNIDFLFIYRGDEQTSESRKFRDTEEIEACRENCIVGLTVIKLEISTFMFSIHWSLCEPYGYLGGCQSKTIWMLKCLQNTSYLIFIIFSINRNKQINSVKSKIIVMLWLVSTVK